jgi:Ca2+/Na+ antiporter
MISAPIVQKNIFDTIKDSFLMYVFFIMLTKTAKYIFIGCFVLLCITYLLVLYDKQIDESEDHPNKKRNQNRNQYILSLLYTIIITLTIIGVIIYMGEKKIEYGKKFNYFNFFLGEPTCKGKTPKVNISDAIIRAFT